MRVAIAVGREVNAFLAGVVGETLAGAEVILAEDLAEAERTVRFARPDLLLLYSDLPGPRPVEATLAALASALPSLRIILLVTGFRRPEKAEVLAAARQAGIRDVLIDERAEEEIDLPELRRLLRSGRSPAEAEAFYAARLPAPDGPKLRLGNSLPREAAPFNPVVAVVSPLAGSGKTTVAAELIMLAAADGRRVSGVDLNVFSGDLADRLGLGGQGPGLESLLRDPTRMAGFWRERGGLSLIPGVSEEHIGSLRDVPLEKYREILAQARGRGELTILDTGSVLDDPSTFAALEQADLILLVAEPEIGRLKRFRERLRWILRSGVPAGKLRLVINKSGLGGEDPGEITEVLAREVPSLGQATVLPFQPEAHRRAARDHGSVSLREPSSGPWHRLLNRVEGGGPVSETVRPRWRRLLGRRVLT